MEIDEFDLWFQANKGPDDPDEPGDHPNCPYYHQHQQASVIERQFIIAAGQKWDKYDGEIVELMNQRSQAEASK